MRLIDADKIVEVAEHAYGEWNKAMAAAEKRQINRCFKMQELCKAVKGVADDCPTIDPESLRLRQNRLKHWMKVQTEAGRLALAVHGNPDGQHHSTNIAPTAVQKW